MADDGLIAGSRRKLVKPGALPPVTVIEIVSRDHDGEFVGASRHLGRSSRAPAPHTHGREQARNGSGRRHRRPRAGADHSRWASMPTIPIRRGTIKQLARAAQPDARHLPRAAGRHRRHRSRRPQAAEGMAGCARGHQRCRERRAGPLRARPRRRAGVQSARVTERLGNPQAQQMTSLIAVHAHGIPDTFPNAVLAEAEAAATPDLKRREDLRHLPLVTIDPSDARDHDDAVWAEADPNPATKAAGWSSWPLPTSPLMSTPGKRARQGSASRGNSVYFPDRVVPMLPERISNDLCSLKERRAAACLAVRMVFDKDGRKQRAPLLPRPDALGCEPQPMSRRKRQSTARTTRRPGRCSTPCSGPYGAPMRA